MNKRTENWRRARRYYTVWRAVLEVLYAMRHRCTVRHPSEVAN